MTTVPNRAVYYSDAVANQKLQPVIKTESVNLLFRFASREASPPVSPPSPSVPPPSHILFRSSPNDLPLDFSMKRRSTSPPPYACGRRPPPPSYEAAVASKPTSVNSPPSSVDCTSSPGRADRPSVICPVPRKESGEEGSWNCGGESTRREITIVEGWYLELNKLDASAVLSCAHLLTPQPYSY